MGEAVYEGVEASADAKVVLDVLAIQSIVGIEGDEQSDGTR